MLGVDREVRRGRIWPLYAGGFLGPFGGAMVTPMLPELHVGLHTSLGTAAWAAMPAYQIPFATCVIISGTFGERWGRRRTMRLAYALYPWASLLCASAGSMPVFLAGRGLQGVANAFLTPLLLATLSDAVPKNRLCRVLGTFASMQAAGQAFAPLAGGVAATVDYRLAFLASMVAAACLSLIPLPMVEDDADTDADTDTGRRTERGAGPVHPWRALLNRRLAMTFLVAFCLYLTAYGVMLLVALRAGDHFGLGPSGAGLVVAAFGVAGLVGGSALGHVAHRVGMIRFGAASLLALATGVALVGQVGRLLTLVAVVAVCGACSTGARIVVNALAVTSTPVNRGGATSVTLAGLFLGSAAAPLICLPVYRVQEGLGLLVAASGGVTGAFVLVVAHWRKRRRMVHRKDKVIERPDRTGRAYLLPGGSRKALGRPTNLVVSSSGAIAGVEPPGIEVDVVALNGPNNEI